MSNRPSNLGIALASLGRNVHENPMSIVAHIIGGAAIGGMAWGISTALDRDASDALRVKDRPACFSMAPEITNVFLDLQQFVRTENPAEQEAFEEAIVQADGLLALEQKVEDGSIHPTTAEIADASGFVRRTVAALRVVRDAQTSNTRVSIINKHIARISELTSAHVSNIRSASMSGTRK